MNLVDKFLTNFVKGKDAWWEAREITRKLQTAGDEPQAAAVMQSLIPTEHGLIVDLNKYRAGRDLKKFLDCGVAGFIFRIGGPSQWVEGDYKYQEDATWRPYMDQARALGVAKYSGGYIIHNPFEDWHLQGVVSNVHINLLNQWTSGVYMPGYLCVDHEVNYCYRGATKITITGYNLVESLKSITDQIWKTFHKVPLIYTARWFIDQNDPARHMAFFDSINNPEQLRPVWYAWYNMINSKTYNTAGEFMNEIPTPTADQIAKLLQCGSYSEYLGHQCTNQFRLKGGMSDGKDDTVGVDASYTRGTFAQFLAALNITYTEPTPDPGDGDTTPPPTGEVTRQEFDALKLAFENHTHGKPV